MHISTVYRSFRARVVPGQRPQVVSRARAPEASVTHAGTDPLAELLDQKTRIEADVYQLRSQLGLVERCGPPQTNFLTHQRAGQQCVTEPASSGEYHSLSPKQWLYLAYRRSTHSFHRPCCQCSGSSRASSFGCGRCRRISTTSRAKAPRPCTSRAANPMARCSGKCEKSR